MTTAAEPVRNSWRDLLPLALVALVIAGVAAAFIEPWLPKAPPGSVALERYAPMRDGGARLTVAYDGDGKVKSWAGSNDRVLPPAAAVASELREAQRKALGKFLAQPGEAPLELDQVMQRLGRGGTVYQTRSITLEADGKSSESIYFSYRDARGDFLLSVYNPAENLDVTFEPPLRVLDGDLSRGAQWESKGARLVKESAVAFSYTGQVLGIETLQSGGVEYRDCAKVETHMRISNKAETLFESRTSYWFAPGVGVVQWESFDPAGKLTERTVLVSDDQMRLPKALPPPPKSSEPAAAKTGPGAWQLTRFAPGHPGIENASATVLPTWLDTDPPLILTAQGRDLTALTTGANAGNVAWRFRPAADIYGQSVWDREHGRIYFGAADKRLYALDTRGLFLWSFQTGDNIATRPIFADGRVFFGSEDRRVYALDATTGREQWHVNTGAAVVGSPVFHGNRVIIGSDDGSIYALSPEKGEQLWSFDANNPIEAPLAVADKNVIACTRGGDVIALDPETGKPAWTTSLNGPLDSAPAITADRLFVSEGGRIHALALGDGHELWQTRDEGFFGTPAIFQDSLVATLNGGKVRRFDFDGQRLGEWSTADDGGGSFYFGVSTGGGACWLVHRDGLVRRLGPELVGPKPLKPAWTRRFGVEPFGVNYLNVTPAAYGDKAVLVDGGRDVFLIDPAGASDVKKIGAIAGKNSVTMDPAVAGDILAATVGTTLNAIHLPDGKPLWSFDGQGTSLRPPTAAGDLFLWFVQRAEAKDAAPAEGVLFAIEAQTGQVRWQQTLKGFGGPGGAVRSGDLVFSSTPPAAFDAATGAPKWQGQAAGLGMGGPALSEAGDRLYVAFAEPQAKGGTVAAFAAKDGALLWQKPLGEATLNPLERPCPAGDLVIVPLWDGEIAALTATDGSQKWRYKPNKPRLGGITVAGSHVWFMQQNLELGALDLTTGDPRARFSLDVDLSSLRSFAPRPLVIGNRVLAPFTMLVGAFDVPKEH
jgi:outer membrane protein assembly factor BamB